MINNYETFQLLLKIFHANYKNFDLDFTFVQSGYALIKKLNDYHQKKYHLKNTGQNIL